MLRRRDAVIAAVAVAAILALIPIGRAERSRHVAKQNAGIARIRAEVGPLASPSLAGYRRLRAFDCLTYRRGDDPFALELCFLDNGDIVEAIDRRSGEPVIWSLRADSKRAAHGVDPQLVRRLLRRMDAPPPTR